MIIQPFTNTDEECAALIRLNALLEPEDQMTIDLLRDEDKEVEAEHQLMRVLGVLNDQIVASGAYWYPSNDIHGKFQFSMSVHPDLQKSHFPGQIHRYLLSKIEDSYPAVIVSEAKENERYLIRLLEDSKFELKMRFPRSQLNVPDFDTSAYDDLVSGKTIRGIEFVTLTDVMKTDPNWQKNVWRMFTIIEADVPSPEPVRTTPFEEYAKYYEGDLFRPKSWTIAIDTALDGPQRYVGMCVVNIMPARPDTLYAGITGIVPGHRRRKIATILKVCGVKFAQEQGYQYIYTDNKEDNPMFTLNLQLGFEPLPAWVYYEKKMR
jgi:hypothetical protein